VGKSSAVEWEGPTWQVRGLVNEKACQILSRMTDAEWATLILRLGRYALRTSGNLNWRTGNKRELPSGETAESIVSKAIEKVLSGKRKWNPGTHPSFERYLMDVIDSLLNQLANSHDNVKFEIISDGQDNDGSNLPEEPPEHPEASAEWLGRPPLTPEEEMLKKERNKRNDEVVGALIADCDDDPLLKKILEAMVDGYEKPASIAERVGCTPSEVYVASKRLDTKIDSFRKRLATEAPPPALKGKENV
jgi:hypothetical protein